MNDTQEKAANLPVTTRLTKYLRGLAGRVLIYLFAYFVISFLTIGPCFWSWFEAVYVDGPKWVAKFYAPLLWICDRWAFLSWLVNKYINWWIM